MQKGNLAYEIRINMEEATLEDLYAFVDACRRHDATTLRPDYGDTVDDYRGHVATLGTDEL